jgi:hypothetical protein
MERNLAIRSGPELMPTLLQLAPLTLEIVELPIHNNTNPPILIGDRLIPSGQIDDA